MPTSQSARTDRGRTAPAVLLLGLLSLVVACGPKGSDFDPLDVVAPSFTHEEEREIGYAFDQELQRNADVVDDPLVAGFLNDLGRVVLARAEPQPFVYRFRLIRQSSLNAFAVFGGYVYFHTGTVVQAGSVDELAGVMGHEIAHVRLQHHRKLAQRAQIPDLVSTLAGIAAAAATGEPGALIAAQGINVALQLRFSREFEAEADYEGTRYMAEAGFDPTGIARFFDKILKRRRADPERIPPYLFSHPDVEQRVEAVKLRAAELSPGDPLLEDFESRLRAVQARLAELDAGGARATEGGDPARHFAAGERALADGRAADAAAAFERTARLDPTRALPFVKLGEAYEAIASRQQAVYAYEQALRRAGPGGTVAKTAERRVERLTFQVLDATELGVEDDGSGSPSLVLRTALGPRFREAGPRFQVHWFGPDALARGEQTFEVRGEQALARFVPADPTAGRWRAEIRLDGVAVGDAEAVLPTP